VAGGAGGETERKRGARRPRGTKVASDSLWGPLLSAQIGHKAALSGCLMRAN
jgi:hypothetical protein